MELYLLTNLDDLVNAGVCMDVDVADPLTVTQHRDALGRSLNVLHQLGRTSGDDQVDHLVQSAKICHFLPSGHLERQQTQHRRVFTLYLKIQIHKKGPTQVTSIQLMRGNFF